MAALCASTLVLAACGGSGGGAGAPSGAAEGPVKLALLASTSQQDTFATPGQVEGAQFAVETLNAAGGIDGRQVELTQYRMPADPNVASSNLLEAAGRKPAVMMGLPLSSTAQTLASRVAQLGVPFINFNAIPDAYKGSPSGSPWGFFMRSDNAATMQAGLAGFLRQHPDAKTAGLLCLGTATGKDLCAGAQKALDAAGVRVVGTQAVNVDDTDFANQAVAMKGADVVVLTVTPAQVPTVAKALKNTGSEPLLFGSASVAALPKDALPADILPRLSGVVDCVPSSPTASAATKDWAARFQTKYGFAPNFFAAESYDSVMVAAAAIRASGSGEPQAIATALATMPSYEGICSTYQANDKQILNKRSVIATYDAQGVLQTGEAVEIP